MKTRTQIFIKYDPDRISIILEPETGFVFIPKKTPIERKKCGLSESKQRRIKKTSR